MRRTNKGDPQAETDEEGGSVKPYPASTTLGPKRPRSSYFPDEELLSPPHYQTRFRSRVLLQGSAASAPQPGRQNIFCGGQLNRSPQETWSQRRSGMNDSGFAMDDTEDDDPATREPGGNGLNNSSRLQKTNRSDHRVEWLNTQLTSKLVQVSSQKRRKVDSPTRVHGYYQPAKVSDLSSDDGSLEQGDLSEEGFRSSTSYTSSSDTSPAFSSSCSDLNEDDGDEQQSKQSASTPKSFIIKSSRPVRAAKSKAGTVTATTVRSSTKAAPSQIAPPKSTTKAAKVAAAAVTPALKKGVFGNPSRVSAIKRPATAPTTVLCPPQHHPIAKIVPRPINTTDTIARSRSRPPRQARLKTGRWTKAEDIALYKGVVEYLAQFGLEPKPPAHLPLQEGPKGRGIEEKDEAHKYEHGDVYENLRLSASERMVDESRHRIEHEAAAVWRASAAVCQMGEPYRVSNHNYGYTSESDAVKDRENDLHLFDELVDISRDNDQADSGQVDSLNLEPQSGHGHHAPLLLPIHVSSPIENAGVNMNARFAAESGSLNAHTDFSPSGNTFVRATTRPPQPTIKPQETCIGAHDQNTQVFDDYRNYNNDLCSQNHQQQYTQFQQQYSPHLRDVTYASQDQNYHHMHQQHYLWQPLSPPQLQQQHRHQQQHGSGQQYVYPGIHPHLEEASHETQAGDVWLAQINGVNSKTLELSTAAHRRAIPVSSTSFTTEGGYIRSSSSIKLSTPVAAEEAAVEMALFGELFPDTTNTTTATTSSASPPPKIITINPTSTTLPPSPSSRYKTQASYSSAISRRLTTCPWSHIATLTVPGRTGVQAQARWSEALDPRVKKGPWSEEEDALLLEGVERSDKCWIWIADSIEGRTQRQCRTRWVQLTINAERKAALAALESVTEF